MVLEIRLANFFSIKEEITLDLSAANIQTKQAKELSDNIFQFNKTDIIKTLALYGANASGKSNIIKAIRFCVSTVTNSHTNNEKTTFSFAPFKFDGYSSKPSSFFIRFVHNEVEYEYSFQLTRLQIMKESLYFYPKGRITKVFERVETAGATKKEKYSFGSQITRPLDVAESTSVKTLFISRASQMDREIAKEVFSFFHDYFILDIILPNDEKIEYYFNNYKNDLLTAMQIADSDIMDLSIRKDVIPTKSMSFDMRQIGEKMLYTVSEEKVEKISVSSHHKKDEKLHFDFFTEESAGTIKLFRSLLTILDITKENKILIIDELETNLHPHIVEFIMKLFNKSKSAQLIFATHNTHLLDLKKFRKDQIYFCNKREDASTELYSLYDFKDFRETMNVENAYLQGRFGAIPIIDDSESKIMRLINE